MDRRTQLLATVTFGLVAFVGCSSSPNNDLFETGGATMSNEGSAGGNASSGGMKAAGGIAATAETASTGGNRGSGGIRSTGGAPVTGGASGAGGTSAKGSGGAPVTGRASNTGGTSANTKGTGGAPVTGGASGAGGTSAKGSGGTPVTAGAPGTGGTSAKGSVPNTGGATMTGGASSAGGNTGGTGRSVGYSPCPASGACKVMPFGDSITEGMRYEGGYRIELFAKAVAAGQNITFTGSLSNGPTTVSGKPFPQKNEGHGGATISTGGNQIADKIPSPAFSTNSGGIPNIILLHIGTNDVLGQSSPSDMSNRLGALIDKVIGAAPDALLVVAKIIPIGSSTSPTIKSYNDAIPALVQTRAAAGKHILLADMNTGFDASKMLNSDGVHPNETGYNFMGDQWYSVIGSLLPKQ